ncbi:FAD-dependent monooxygenase [Rhizosphaericola mali]|uniref:FAD-binding monooxygenase n=1 Tax=Rhizosphaericola mali TaxID=2545455 RepID=A0A5P2G3N5_9BACT|nr:FAD-dependent monooxygenase [Rhizosphaericola mali]QES88432.1 FAD-binding monooxygenase [Rhizosphaericola mali]
MKKQVLISGASVAGLSLAYWLNKFDFEVTVVEISKSLRRGGSPIDVRGEALNVAKEMGILEKIKAKEFIHQDEIVNAHNETIVSFSLNDQPEYRGDIEIHRDDLVDILFENIPKDQVHFLFGNRIGTLVQSDTNVDVTLKNGETLSFDFVFGADGTHSAVRKLAFGKEENYSQFFNEYFAIIEAPDVKPNHPNGGAMYNEPGKMVGLYPFKNGVNAFLVFSSPKLDWDYKNQAQQKQIIKEHFQNGKWRIPEILNALDKVEHIYFDEVCQIHMSSWTTGRVALLGDAAHAASFHTGMGTSLAMQGATLLAQKLHEIEDYQQAFTAYNESFRPFVESIQAKITRGMKYLVPQTEEDIQEAYKRFK